MSTTAQLTAVLGLMYTGYVGSGSDLYVGMASERAAAGYTTLVDNAIAIGQDKLPEQSTPPRIIVVPKGISEVRSVDPVNSVRQIAAGQLPLNVLPRIASEFVEMEVHCWGVDYDDCIDLHQAFVRALHNVLSSGGYHVGRGEYRKPGATTLARWLVFPVAWELAITLPPIPLPIPTAPSGTAGAGTLYLDQPPPNTPTSQNDGTY